MKQSIIRMLQYGNEFFVKYQFNILSNGFFIYYHLQIGCKISINIGIKQIFINLFHFFGEKTLASLVLNRLFRINCTKIWIYRIIIVILRLENRRF